MFIYKLNIHKDYFRLNTLTFLYEYKKINSYPQKLILEVSLICVFYHRI